MSNITPIQPPPEPKPITPPFPRSAAEKVMSANAYLRRAARYDFKWDHIGSLEDKFNRYITVVPAAGVLTVLTNRLELQNGFGGYRRVTLYCDYDTQTKEVLRYWINQ